MRCTYALWICLTLIGSCPAIRAQSPLPVEVAAPSYPRIPPGFEESGEVEVGVSISSAGEVLTANAISGPQRLRAAAVAAARLWRFHPQETGTDKWRMTFAFIYRAGIGNPPAVASIFKPPSRMEIFAQERKVGVIEDPPVGVVKKSK